MGHKWTEATRTTAQASPEAVYLDNQALSDALANGDRIFSWTRWQNFGFSRGCAKKAYTTSGEGRSKKFYVLKGRRGGYALSECSLSLSLPPSLTHSLTHSPTLSLSLSSIHRSSEPETDPSIATRH